MKHTTDGIQITQPYEVSGAFVSATATLANGTATSLITGDADYYLDLVEIMFSSTSTVALGTANFSITLINDGETYRTFAMGEGQDVVQCTFPAPLRQNVKNTPWNIDMDDVTGTSVNVAATFVKKSRQ